MTKGTTPAGASTEREAAAWVRDMFGRVAPRYDLANHLLSFNIDRAWRRRTVDRVSPILQRPKARVLDLCCGTGDLMLALEQRRGAPVLGSDFCHPMLTAARDKTARRNFRSKVFEADGLALPVAAGSLDLITIAFGFRNFSNYDAGLAELRRVLRPGGMLAILEFTQPPNAAFRALYNVYSRHILPILGGAISGAPDAYTYLPDSVRKFPDAPGLAARIASAGFADVRFEYLTLGIVALHTASVK